MRGWRHTARGASRDPLMDLRGRVALVTGGGIRVGRALVLGLARRGATVAVHYNRSETDARSVVDSASGAGGTAGTFGADLTQDAAAEALVKAVMQRFGRLDVLVNSAAVMMRTPFGDVSPSAWDDMFALNLKAPFLLAQAAAPHLRAAPGGGAIINIADLAAFETWPGYIPHGMTKAGIVYMTRALARVLAPEVRVNAIAPGTVLLPDDFRDEDAAHLTQTTPLRREGSPEDVVQAMLYLIDAEYVTGETVIVDGGRHIRR
jgi:pteridine reductase